MQDRINMKTQQRSFVVEYKNSRRRLDRQSSSIWGKADLKALALEASVQAPYLFDSVVSEASELTLDRPPENVGSHTNHPPATAVESVDEADSKDCSPLRIAKVELSQETDLALSRPRGTTTRPRQPRESSVRDAVYPASSLKVLSSVELEALEQENLDLRRRLSAKLHSENDLLRGLLARFD